MINSKFDLKEITKYVTYDQSMAFKVKPACGLTGESWHICIGQNNLLVRTATKEREFVFLSIRKEFYVLRALQDTGLSPKPIAITKRWLLIEWISGQTLDITGWRFILDQGLLAKRLTELHQYRRYGYPINLKIQFIILWQKLDSKRKTPKLLRLQHYFLRSIPPNPIFISPLHMDIHAGNMLFCKNDNLVFIDWEYAGDGDVALDLAMLFRSNNLSVEDQEKFLYKYLFYIPLSKKKLLHNITVWRPWVDYIILMWYEIRWKNTKDVIFKSIATKLQENFFL